MRPRHHFCGNLWLLKRQIDSLWLMNYILWPQPRLLYAFDCNRLMKKRSTGGGGAMFFTSRHHDERLGPLLLLAWRCTNKKFCF